MAIVNLNNLQVNFAEKTAVSAASFAVDAGETFSLIGASGCGKSTILRVLAGLQRDWRGRVELFDKAIRPGARFQGELRRNVQMVFQDPYASLHPNHTLWRTLAEPLKIHAIGEIEQRVSTALEEVGLPADAARRYPHQLSGGQRQRVAIARALILEPAILVLDEATSALDVTVQAQILALLQQLQQQLDLSYLFITHDLATVRRIADSVTVLRAGQVVEHGDVNRLFAAPQQAYTRELIAAIPQVSSRLAQAHTENA